MFKGSTLFTLDELETCLDEGGKRTQATHWGKSRAHTGDVKQIDLQGYIGEYVFCKLFPGALPLAGDRHQSAQQGTDVGDCVLGDKIIDVKCSIETISKFGRLGFLVRSDKFSVSEINTRIIDLTFKRTITHFSNIIIKEPFTFSSDNAVNYFMDAIYCCTGLLPIGALLEKGRIQLERGFVLPAKHIRDVAYITHPKLDYERECGLKITTLEKIKEVEYNDWKKKHYPVTDTLMHTTTTPLIFDRKRKRT